MHYTWRRQVQMVSRIPYKCSNIKQRHHVAPVHTTYLHVRIEKHYSFHQCIHTGYRDILSLSLLLPGLGEIYCQYYAD